MLPTVVRGGPPAQLQLTGAHCFDGTGFVRRDLWIVDRVFVGERREGLPVQRIDLTERWIVAPFADAHSHSFGEGQPERERERALQYARDGVFAVMSHGNLPLSPTERVALGVGTPDGPDVSFANGMIIPSDGPVRGFYEAVVFPSGAFPGRTFDSLADSRYFAAPDVAALDAKWPLIQAQRSDFIKVYLHNIENDPNVRFAPFFRGVGLSRAVLDAVVAKARAEGLRVSAHVATAGDILAALDAGVDMLAHVPDGPINRAVAQRVAAAQVPVVTTMAFRTRAVPPPARAILEGNLRMLREAGARLVIGADVPSDSSVREAAYLAATGLWSNAELLRMWSVDTPAAIFPARRLGLLPGAEASLLVLTADPLTDWTATGEIERRMKRGAWLP
jgi:imidazolonepropionase-like amidohydrolase